MEQDEVQKLTNKNWTHSHEEDKADEMVFRAAGFKFPPSRGRSSFQLNPDGTLLRSRPGPTDKSQAQQGHWSLDGNELTLDASQNEAPQVLRIKSIEPDKLVVERTS